MSFEAERKDAHDGLMASLADSLREGSVPFHMPQSPSFESLTQSYNRVFAYKPAVVVVPDNAQHVSHTVICAKARNMKVQAKSGGHSYAAYSSGGQDGSVVIDLRNFQDIRVDKSTGIAQVGAGVRLGRLASELFSQDKRALPHGIIPGVGVGGHFTHGGYGYHCRSWGLALDTIVAVNAVLADGSIIRASFEEHPDIFYALRGAADSFGIITSFELQTVAAPATVMLFSIDIHQPVSDPSSATQTFLCIQNFARDASIIDKDLSFGICIHDGIFTIRGVYLKDEVEFRNKIAPALLSGIEQPTNSIIRTMGWLDHLTWFAEQDFSPSSETASDAFYAQSVVIPEASPLTEEAVLNYFKYIQDHEVDDTQAWLSIINLYGGPDSQINVKDTQFSAYAHRSSLWVVQHFGYSKSRKPPLHDNTSEFIAGLTKALTETSSDTAFGAYMNYVDPLLSREKSHELYFGRDVLAKLEKIKEIRDPEEVFWNPQSIRPRQP